ncbi:outer membrane beta-barrel family protein [Chitinophaga qingshengii]|uniref:Outer membrane beta-barrel protein n=1 Tax=Chitinophaga qingshengii TaxID=1569794 RepID=A0ABR7TZ14_9BACT|nr:outer membrane beta-barrel family protein [Chitinophaga qingshengii]MBC9935052.1 outer membrane beta-barrel protein [Chitinophaga qingshengii]
MDGSFIIHPLEVKSALLVFSLLGYATRYVPVTFPGNTDSIFQMKSIGRTIATIDIRSGKPMFEMKSDKIVYHVEPLNDPAAKLEEVLSNAPGVMISKDGVWLNGKPGTAILVDGQQKGALEQLKNIIPVSNIQRIEIINNPSAKYDAQGTAGIINIILKKRYSEKFNMTFDAGWGVARENRYNANVNWNYGSKRLRLYGNTGYYKIGSFDRNLNNQVGSNFTQAGMQEHTLQRYLGNLTAGLGYAINKRHEVTVEISPGFSKEKNYSERGTIRIIPESKTRNQLYSNERIQGNSFSGSFFYTGYLDTASSRKLTGDVNYVKYKTRTWGQYDNDFDGSIPPVFLQSDNPLDISLTSGAINYEGPIGKKMSLEAGVKTAFTRTDAIASYDTVIRPGVLKEDIYRNSSNWYKESIHAAYATISGKFWNTDLKFGLRLENTVYETGTKESRASDNYFSLFPSVSIGRQLNDKHSLSLGFSRRIQRQQYEYMTPVIRYVNDYTYIQGNPGTKPAFSYNADFNYAYNHILFISAGYSYTYHAIMQTQELVADSATKISMDNVAAYQNYYFSVSVPLTVTKWWTMNNSAGGYTNMTSSDSKVIPYNDGYNFTFHARNINRFTIPGGFRLSLISGYKSPAVFNQVRSLSVFTMSIGIRRTSKDQRFAVSCGIDDLLNTDKDRYILRYTGIVDESSRKYDSRRFSIGIYYKIGERKNNTYRQKSNDEEIGRFNNKTSN